MSDVQFEEQQNLNPRQGFNINTPSTPPLIRLVMSLKLAQDEESASKVLMGFAITAFIVSGIVAKVFLFPAEPKVKDFSELTFEEKALIPNDILLELEKRALQQ